MTSEILLITTEEVDFNIFIVNLAKTNTRKSFYNNPSILSSNILTKKTDEKCLNSTEDCSKVDNSISLASIDFQKSSNLINTES